MTSPLDFLTGNDAAASPWGMLYQGPQPGSANDPVYRSMIYGNPFGSPTDYSVTLPTQPLTQGALGSQAMPFSFAPTITDVQSGQLAPPASPPPQRVQPRAEDAAGSEGPGASAAPGAAAPGATTPGAPMNILPRLMPDPPAPFGFGEVGLADRLEKGVRGFVGNVHNGALGAIAGGLGALVTGRSTDADGIQQEQMKAGGTMLLAHGVDPADVQAAMNNPVVMDAWVKRIVGAATPSGAGAGWQDGNAVRTYQPTATPNDPQASAAAPPAQPIAPEQSAGADAAGAAATVAPAASAPVDAKRTAAPPSETPKPIAAGNAASVGKPPPAARPKTNAGGMTGDQIFQGFRDRGYSPALAAALTGNILQESGGNPQALNQKEGAYGFMQWRLDRRKDLEAFAAARGLQPNDPNVQLDYIAAEMRGKERRAGKAFLATDDVAAANQALKRYIRYGDDSQAKRLAYARAFLPQAAAQPAPQAAPVTAAPPAAPPQPGLAALAAVPQFRNILPNPANLAPFSPFSLLR